MVGFRDEIAHRQKLGGSMKNIIVGNWKLYVRSLADGKKILRGIDRFFPRGVKAEVVVCPPVALAVALRQDTAAGDLYLAHKTPLLTRRGHTLARYRQSISPSQA